MAALWQFGVFLSFSLFGMLVGRTFRSGRIKNCDEGLHEADICQVSGRRSWLQRYHMETTTAVTGHLEQFVFSSTSFWCWWSFSRVPEKREREVPGSCDHLQSSAVALEHQQLSDVHSSKTAQDSPVCTYCYLLLFWHVSILWCFDLRLYVGCLISSFVKHFEMFCLCHFFFKSSN